MRSKLAASYERLQLTSVLVQNFRSLQTPDYRFFHKKRRYCGSY